MCMSVPQTGKSHPTRAPPNRAIPASGIKVLISLMKGVRGTPSGLWRDTHWKEKMYMKRNHMGRHPDWCVCGTTFICTYTHCKQDAYFWPCYPWPDSDNESNGRSRFGHYCHSFVIWETWDQATFGSQLQVERRKHVLTWRTMYVNLYVFLISIERQLFHAWTS